jgi:hypothetical protein
MHPGLYQFTNIYVGRDSASGMRTMLLLVQRPKCRYASVETPRFAARTGPVGAAAQIASIGGPTDYKTE